MHSELRTPNSPLRWGFSLVELIISLAILSVGLVGAMRVFPVGLRASQRAELQSRATMAAQRHLVSLVLQPWDQLHEGETVSTDEAFTLTTRVRVAPLEGISDPTRLKALEVQVAWTEDGRPRHLTFMTYVRRETTS